MTDTVKFEIEVPTPIAMFIALGQGWTPTVDDLEAELDGDTVPKKPNPVTLEIFMSAVGAAFLREQVIDEGKQAIAARIQTASESTQSLLANGEYNDLIEAGQFDAVLAAMIQELMQTVQS